MGQLVNMAEIILSYVTCLLLGLSCPFFDAMAQSLIDLSEFFFELIFVALPWFFFLDLLGMCPLFYIGMSSFSSIFD